MTDELAVHVKQVSEYAAMANALLAVGVDPDAVNVSPVAVYRPVDLGELCQIPCGWKNAVGRSPLMTIVTLREFPTSTEFEDYMGYFQVDAVTESGDYVMWSSYMTHRATGELGPLWEWISRGTLPLLICVVRVATRTVGRHVYRPVPVSL